MASQSCESLGPHVVDFIVGELDEKRAREMGVLQHLAECARCRAVAEQLRGTGRALDAVATMAPALREEVRRKITSQAHVEAQIIRTTREHQLISGRLPARRVPVLAWGILAAGTALAVAAGWLLPRAGESSPVGVVAGVEGGAPVPALRLGSRIFQGQRISVPSGCLLSLRLEDGSRLDAFGPCEMCAMSGEQPWELTRGQVYLVASSRMSIRLPSLKALEAGRGAGLVLTADPAGRMAGLVSVLAGSVDYSADGGAGHVKAGQSMEIDGRNGSAHIREMHAADRPAWLPKRDPQ
jgi:hypothetical protein